MQEIEQQFTEELYELLKRYEDKIPVQRIIWILETCFVRGFNYAEGFPVIDELDGIKQVPTPKGNAV